MKLLISLIAMLASSLSINANANELMFKCSTQNNKTISIYQDGNNLTYKFGRKNSKPEMDLTKNKEQRTAKHYARNSCRYRAKQLSRV